MVPLTLCCLFFSPFLLFSPTAGDHLDYQDVFDRRFHFVQARSDLSRERFCLEDFLYVYPNYGSTSSATVLAWSWQGDVRGNDQPPDRNYTRRLSFHTAPESLIKYDHDSFFLLRFSTSPEMKSLIVMLKSASSLAVTRIFTWVCTGLSIFEVATVSNWSRVRGRYPTRCITTTISSMNHQGTQRYEVQKCAQHRGHTGFGISGTVWESNWWSRDPRTRTYGLDCREPPCIAHVP